MTPDELEQIMRVVGLAVAIAVGASIVVGLFKKFLYICSPHEILVVSGKAQQLAGGESVDFSVIQAGRHWKIPYIQTVKRMDMRIIPIDIQVSKVLSNGGIPLDVHAIANIKITSDPKFVHNAVERFLDLPIDNLRNAAKQTLEGMIRAVIAQLTPEQVNQDRIEFANRLVEATGDDFNKMGLHLDTLKILKVDDEAQYLVNIGRTQIANAIRDAETAESQANQEVAQEEAAAQQAAEVAQKQAEIGVAQKRNQLRTYTAQLEGAAQSVEREAQVAAEQARAEAEQELQTIRKEVEARRLQVEIVLPADADRRSAELIAQGAVAPRREQAAAVAAGIALMSEALGKAGPEGRELYVLSQLDTIVAQVAERVRAIEIGKVQLVDSGDGKALSNLAASYPAAVVEVLKTAKEVTGVDVGALVGGGES